MKRAFYRRRGRRYVWQSPSADLSVLVGQLSVDHPELSQVLEDAASSAREIWR